MQNDKFETMSVVSLSNSFDYFCGLGCHKGQAFTLHYILIILFIILQLIFIELMMGAIDGPICKNFLFLIISEFWIIVNKP